VAVNDDWLVVVPWWAVWPYETMLMPYRRHIQRLEDLTPAEKQSLAAIIKCDSHPPCHIE